MSINPKDLQNTLQNAKQSGYTMLLGIFCVDVSTSSERKFKLIYNLYDPELRRKEIVEMFVNSVAPSVCAIFKSANFDEREIFDMFGVVFEGHLDLKRILMPETWLKHPLCKDYTLEDARLAWRK